MWKGNASALRKHPSGGEEKVSLMTENVDRDGQRLPLSATRSDEDDDYLDINSSALFLRRRQHLFDLAGQQDGATPCAGNFATAGCSGAQMFPCNVAESGAQMFPCNVAEIGPKNDTLHDLGACGTDNNDALPELQPSPFQNQLFTEKAETENPSNADCWNGAKPKKKLAPIGVPIKVPEIIISKVSTFPSTYSNVNSCNVPFPRLEIFSLPIFSSH